MGVGPPGCEGMGVAVTVGIKPQFGIRATQRSVLKRDDRVVIPKDFVGVRDVVLGNKSRVGTDRHPRDRHSLTRAAGRPAPAASHKNILRRVARTGIGRRVEFHVAGLPCVGMYDDPQTPPALRARVRGHLPSVSRGGPGQVQPPTACLAVVGVYADRKVLGFILVHQDQPALDLVVSPVTGRIRGRFLEVLELPDAG